MRRVVLQADELFGATVADRVLGALIEAFELLASHPGAGHRREDLTQRPDVRFWAVGPSLVAYRQRDGLVEILIVERGEVDWRRMFHDA